MQKGIHPEKTTVTYSCACGNQFQALSTGRNESISVEICNKCHPYFTGESRFVDTAGRIEIFEKKRKATEKLKSKKVEAIKAKIQKKQEKKEINNTASLKDMLKNLA